MANGIELSDAAIGAILATSSILLCALLVLALLWSRLWSWASRHKKLWVECDDDGEVRFGGELRAQSVPALPPAAHMPLSDPLTNDS